MILSSLSSVAVFNPIAAVSSDTYHHLVTFANVNRILLLIILICTVDKLILGGISSSTLEHGLPSQALLVLCTWQLAPCTLQSPPVTGVFGRTATEQ